MSMQFHEAMKDMFINSGTNANRVSKEIFGNNTIQVSKSRGSVMNVDTVAKIAEHCGYELCLIPAASVPRNAIPISPDQSKPMKDDGVRLGEGNAPATSEDMIG